MSAPDDERRGGIPEAAESQAAQQPSLALADAEWGANGSYSVLAYSPPASSSPLSLRSQSCTPVELMLERHDCHEHRHEALPTQCVGQDAWGTTTWHARDEAVEPNDENADPGGLPRAERPSHRRPRITFALDEHMECYVSEAPPAGALGDGGHDGGSGGSDRAHPVRRTDDDDDKQDDDDDDDDANCTDGTERVTASSTVASVHPESSVTPDARWGGTEPGLGGTSSDPSDPFAVAAREAADGSCSVEEDDAVVGLTPVASATPLTQAVPPPGTPVDRLDDDAVDDDDWGGLPVEFQESDDDGDKVDALECGDDSDMDVDVVSAEAPKRPRVEEGPLLDGPVREAAVAPVPPRPMAPVELRALREQRRIQREALQKMTCKDIRYVMEQYWLTKDKWWHHFDKARHALLSAAESQDTLRQRHRHHRLVNVSRWGDGGPTSDDVLLPQCLMGDGPSGAPPVEGSGTADEPTLAGMRLRPHQVNGIRFMWSLLVDSPVGQVPSVGCILAHTMGLGKTCQVVVFLHLYCMWTKAWARTASESPASALGVGRARRPRILIVIPKSLRAGWEGEFDRWSRCVPPAHRLSPVFIDERLPPLRRVDTYRAWRRMGGVLVIGYEALVSLSRMVSQKTAPTMATAPRTDGGAAGRRSDSSLDHILRRVGRGSQPWALALRRDPLFGSGGNDDDGKGDHDEDDDGVTELLVCDEAHRLKSSKLQVVRALHSLNPERRLLLTGTPLQNHLREYWEMVDFAIPGYFERRRFLDFFVTPIEAAISRDASPASIAVARKKTFTLIKELSHFVQRVDSNPLREELPPLHEYVVVVPLSDQQQRLYMQFLHIMRLEKMEHFNLLQAVAYASKITAHPMLLYQQRMSSQPNATAAHSNWAFRVPLGQQGGSENAVDHQLYPSSSSAAVNVDQDDGDCGDGDGRSGRSSAGGVGACGSSKSSSSDESEGNVDGNNNSSSSSSGSGTHVHATSSRKRVRDIAGRDGGAVVSSAQELSGIPWTTACDRRSALLDRYTQLRVPPKGYAPQPSDGHKLLVAVHIIQAAMEVGEKTLVFSMSTKLLDFFERLMAQLSGPSGAGIRFVRLDGSSTSVEREAMIRSFQSRGVPAGGPPLHALSGKPGVDPSPHVFLLSTKAGGVGITVTAATRVILLDSSFNPADDRQAIGRAYRYGQTKPVFVYRLMCEHTLEHRIFDQKIAKEWLFKTVVEEARVKRESLAGTRLREIFRLLSGKPAVITERQRQATAAIAAEDAIVRRIQPEVSFVQRHDCFLEHDEEDEYGSAESSYYETYRRGSVFLVDAENGLASSNATASTEHQQLLDQRRREAEERMLVVRQSQTLSAMIGEIVKKKTDSDPRLRELLLRMGVGQPWTGEPTAAATPPSPSPRHPESSRPYAAAAAPRRAPVILIDDDDDNDEGDDGVGSSGCHGRSSSRGPGTAATVAAAHLEPSRREPPPPLRIDAAQYASYRPGSSAESAVCIDDEQSQ